MRILSFLVLAVTGLGMAVPGFYLVTLGGSLYYAIAGVLILASAWLILRRRPFGVALFWLVFAATFLWSLWEVGLDSWALMPRLVYLAAAAGALLLLDFAPLRRPVALLMVFVLAVAAGAVFLTSRESVSQTASAAAPRATSAADGEWAYYGGSQNATRYSRL